HPNETHARADERKSNAIIASQSRVEAETGEWITRRYDRAARWPRLLLTQKRLNLLPAQSAGRELRLTLFADTIALWNAGRVLVFHCLAPLVVHPSTRSQSVAENGHEQTARHASASAH